MSDAQPGPPRVARALLQSLLRPSDAESIPGDLLEEYRAVRHPALGQRRADAWYLRHVLSVLWHLAWPCLVAITALRILSFPLPRGWNPGLVPAPGVSLLDAVLFLWAGYYGSQRTGRISTGVVIATLTSVLGFTLFFVYAGVTTPQLLLAPIEKPFIFVIVSILLAIALSFAVVFGTVGGAAGRWLPPSRWKTRVS